MSFRHVVTETVANMLANGEAIPEPLAEKRYSGQFRIRIPPEVHRTLAIEAAEQSISMNQLASAN